MVSSVFRTTMWMRPLGAGVVLVRKMNVLGVSFTPLSTKMFSSVDIR